MRITTQLDIPFELKVNNKPVFYKDIRIGRISKSYIKDGKIWMNIIVNKKKQQFFKKLINLLKEI